MLPLNSKLYDGRPSPNIIAVTIRSARLSVKAAAKSLLRCLKRRETVVNAETDKTFEEALNEYRQTLKNTFGNSEMIDDVINVVRDRLG